MSRKNISKYTVSKCAANLIGNKGYEIADAVMGDCRSDFAKTLADEIRAETDLLVAFLNERAASAKTNPNKPKEIEVDKVSVLVH